MRAGREEDPMFITQDQRDRAKAELSLLDPAERERLLVGIYARLSAAPDDAALRRLVADVRWTVHARGRLPWYRKAVAYRPRSGGPSVAVEDVLRQLDTREETRCDADPGTSPTARSR
jgi:hypothetical protein